VGAKRATGTRIGQLDRTARTAPDSSGQQTAGQQTQRQSPSATRQPLRALYVVSWRGLAWYTQDEHPPSCCNECGPLSIASIDRELIELARSRAARGRKRRPGTDTARDMRMLPRCRFVYITTHMRGSTVPDMTGWSRGTRAHEQPADRRPWLRAAGHLVAAPRRTDAVLDDSSSNAAGARLDMSSQGMGSQVKCASAGQEQHPAARPLGHPQLGSIIGSIDSIAASIVRGERVQARGSS